MSQISLKPIFFNGLQLKLLRNLVPVALGQQADMWLRFATPKFAPLRSANLSYPQNAVKCPVALRFEKIFILEIHDMKKG